MHLAETQRQAEEWEKKTRKPCWHGEARGEKQGILCDRILGHIWLFPVASKLEVGAKFRKAVSY